MIPILDEDSQKKNKKLNTNLAEPYCMQASNPVLIKTICDSNS
jgi:hypothetical protein